jgi:orotate phosphoribosyltransferase
MLILWHTVFLLQDILVVEMGEELVEVAMLVECNWLKTQIIDRGIVRVPAGSKELVEINRQGHYRWQLYLRKVLYDRRAMQVIGAAFWEQHQDLDDFQLAGIEGAGVPVLMSILAHAPRRVNAFTIRKEPKKYGLQNWFEGEPNDLPVVLVDDVISSVHSSFWAALTVLRNARLSVAPTMFAVVNKQYAKFDKIETSQGTVTIKFMFDLDDLEIPIR